MYGLIAIIKKRLKLAPTLYALLQAAPLCENQQRAANQLNLFEFYRTLVHKSLTADYLN